MEFRKILPAAAGVIALTSSIAFAYDYGSLKEPESLRVRVSESDSNNDVTEDSAASFVKCRASGNVFHVSIEHGGISKVVFIDARTGTVIRSV